MQADLQADRDGGRETVQGETTRPGSSLTPRQLTMPLILVTLLPFCLVVLLYVALPIGEGPTLDAQVTVQPRPWPSDQALDARITPCVVLVNPTADDWNNVNMSINEQFDYYHPETLPGNSEIVVPLTYFHTKGNQHFPPERQRLKLLTVYAQIPSGARAIKEFDGEALMPPAEADRGWSSADE